jgi:RNA polymerase sigma factor
VERLLLLLIKRLFGKSGAGGGARNGAQEPPESVVARIRAGEDQLRESFIADYRPYIAKSASRFCKRYIDPSRDDEYSIALAAFNEAIDGFDGNAGKSFLGFADTVIRRRLIDYVRKERRHARSLPMSVFENEQSGESPLNAAETAGAMDAYVSERLSESRRLEIEALAERLAQCGISFADLADRSPRHADSRALLLGISASLARRPELLDVMERHGRLPIKELMECCRVSRKTLERNRKYIMAAALILSGDYPLLQSYLLPAVQEAAVSKEVGS